MDYFHSSCIFVSFHRYLVGYSLMTATVVVVLDVIPDTLSQARHIVLRVDIDILGLDGTPETLYPDIVLAASTAIHADFDTKFLASRQPQAARILATLIGVDDLRCAMGSHGQTEHLNAILLVQRVMQPPGHDTATVDVYYRREVHEPVQHRYIGDVNAPDMIGTGDVTTKLLAENQRINGKNIWCSQRVCVSLAPPCDAVAPSQNTVAPSCDAVEPLQKTVAPPRDAVEPPQKTVAPPCETAKPPQKQWWLRKIFFYLMICRHNDVTRCDTAFYGVMTKMAVVTTSASLLSSPCHFVVTS